MIVSQIRYGITMRKSNDVTIMLKKMLKSSDKINLKDLDLVLIFGDPFPNMVKKLIILFSNRRHTAFFEQNGKLIINKEIIISLDANLDCLIFSHISESLNDKKNPMVLTDKDSMVLTDNEKDRKDINEESKLVVKKAGRQRVFVICNIKQGGTRKYIKDIMDRYHKPLFISIQKKKDLEKYKLTSSDILFIQQLLFTGISVQDLIEIKKTYNPIIVVSIHDFCWFYEGRPQNVPTYDKDWPHNAYLNESLVVDPEVIKFFGQAQHIICPSKFCLDQYTKYFLKHNFIKVYHNDIKIDPETYSVPAIRDNTINIGMMQVLTPCKGLKYMVILKAIFKTYQGYKVRFLSVNDGLPSYEVSDFFKVVRDYNLHALMHLNAVADTYSYTLSYSMNTGLPIIYNNIGAFKERIFPREHYFKVFDDENMVDYQSLFTQFERLLNYIISKNGSKSSKTYENQTIYYNEFYDKLFT